MDDFYGHSAMADGHLNFCKECVKDRVRLYRNQNLELVQEYDRKRGVRTSCQGNRRAYPLKYAARSAVGNAIRDGKLIPQPCERCGEAVTHGHHEDYEKPLSVTWLCSFCHGERHREINAERRGKL